MLQVEQSIFCVSAQLFVMVEFFKKPEPNALLCS